MKIHTRHNKMDASVTSCNRSSVFQAVSFVYHPHPHPFSHFSFTFVVHPLSSSPRLQGPASAHTIRVFCCSSSSRAIPNLPIPFHFAYSLIYLSHHRPMLENPNWNLAFYFFHIIEFSKGFFLLHTLRLNFFPGPRLYLSWMIGLWLVG